MSEAPERIWAKEGYNSLGLDGDWWYTASKGDGVEYVRADIVEELGAKLEKAVEALGLLDKTAGETARMGAATGPHWTRLTIALLKSRATIAELKGYKP